MMYKIDKIMLTDYFHHNYLHLQGMFALIPAMLLLGSASSTKLFYCGIILFAFGM
jgi:hypothetical protein